MLPKRVQEKIDEKEVTTVEGTIETVIYDGAMSIEKSILIHKLLGDCTDELQISLVKNECH